jgi:hypothetical protein
MRVAEIGEEMKKVQGSRHNSEWMIFRSTPIAY